MGKSQKKKATRRHNPVRVPDTHLPKGLDAASKTSGKADEVLPIIQKIEGADAQDRTWACSAVSNLIQNDPSTRRLLQGKNIVGILITRLSDSVDEVVVEAAGALRNLSIDAGYDICAEMFNKNIIPSITALIPKISTALDQFVTAPKDAPENTAELVFNLAENVITLIWCLSETSNKALNAINEMHLAPFLMAFMENRSKLPSRTVAAAAQCLYVLTDDNISVTDDIRSNSSYSSCLLNIASTTEVPPAASEGKELAEVRGVQVRILSAGILRNISPIPAPAAASSVDIDRTVVLPLLIPVLSSASLSDVSSRVTDLISKDVGESETPKLSLKGTPKNDHQSPAERELEYIEARLRNVQLSLEILTGLCATLPDPDFSRGEPEEEGEDDGIDEDDDEADVEMDVEEANDEKPVSNGVTTDSTPAPATLLPTLLPPLLALTAPVPLSFPPLPPSGSSATPLEEQPKTHPPTTSALSAIHIGAFECLNNIFLSLALGPSDSAAAKASSEQVAADVNAGKTVWDGVWAALAVVGVEGVGVAGQEKRMEVWDVAAGVLWGVGGIWKGSIVPEQEQVRVLMQLCDTSRDDQLRVKCIGALECLAQYRDSIQSNNVIASYLLNVISSFQSASGVSSEPVLQAASALIDIYSDESMPYDVNFRRGNVLAALSTSLDNVKRAVKAIDRKKEGGRALRARGEEILTNLRAFIKYRRELKL